MAHSDLAARKALSPLAAVVLLVAGMAASPSPAVAQAFPDLTPRFGDLGGQGGSPTVGCNGMLPKQGLLQDGKGAVNAPDLLIDRTTCTVKVDDTYYFGAVNIINGGQLIFEEPSTKNSHVNFWASSIIVENNGLIRAGTPTVPYGSNGGTLTFYIWGDDKSKGKDPAAHPGKGTLCRTPKTKEQLQGVKKVEVTVAGPCGIPLGVWNGNGASLVTMPHGDKIPDFTDRFYQYGPLYGDNRCSDGTVWNPKTFCGTSKVGYFGNKVFAVSYGGTLQLFGYKGTPLPKGTTTTQSQSGGLRGLAGFPGLSQHLPGSAQSSAGSAKAAKAPGSSLPPCAQGDPDSNPLSTGCSRLRLAADLVGTTTDGQTTKPGERSLALSMDVGTAGTGDNGNDKWWNGAEKGDQIVLTTTDYLPGHSELLTVTSVKGTTVNFKENVKWPHRGTKFPIASRLDPTDANKPFRQRYINAGMDPDLIANGLETRAAVALLTRSIRIVSAGDTAGQTFEQAGSVKGNCKANLPAAAPVAPYCYYYGAHMVFRQGFKRLQIQGVEFQYMGQGGKLGHYPVHFHMARQVPSDTFVKDSVVNESMTRWYVLHATQGVLLQRNIGWWSIGHGFYVEDGTETDNKFYSNLGIFARAAVDNAQNPRKVPGILAANQPQFQVPGFPFRTDAEFPSAFWIENGWNDFVGNMVAGTGACGSGYWFVPTVNNDMPDVPTDQNTDDEKRTISHQIFGHMLWKDKDGVFGYAGLQRAANFGGATPLRVFYGNSSTATMMSFQTTTDVPPCDGFLPPDGVSNFPVVLAIRSFAPPPVTDLLFEGGYYPRSKGDRAATLCAADTSSGKPNCTAAKVREKCSVADENNCAVTVLDHFTSTFTWAHGNVSAVWLRSQWYLLTNSVIADVQNGGVTFVTGGDFTHASIIPGYWAVMMNSILVGHTQPQDSAHRFSLDLGPVNKQSGLQCKAVAAGASPPDYCVVPDEGVSFPVKAFFVNQKLSNIYDGPSYQDSNIYLDVTPTKCAVDTYNGPGGCIYGSRLANGVPKDPSNPSGNPADPSTTPCYLPNAAIGWKQPNGFFYPPAFHSLNLFFDNVAIRHYVINPLFKSAAKPDQKFEFGQGGTYITDDNAVASAYCTQNNTMFNDFTSIDRQTELNDADGTLTGLSNDVTPGNNIPAALKQTISVNEDAFFTAPVETPECASNAGTNVLPANACNPPSTSQPLVTAKTSPYDYIATVVYHKENPQIWDKDCTNPRCYGVPLYRQFLAGTKPTDLKTGAGATREWLHWFKNGCFDTPNKPECRWPFIRMAGAAISTRETLTINNGLYYLDTAVPVNVQKGENYNTQGSNTSVNVFQAGETYYVFFLYAKKTTRQTYQVSVGKDLKGGSVKPVRVKIPDANLMPLQDGDTQPWLTVDPSTVMTDGIVSVTIDFSKLQQPELDPLPVNGLCQPRKFCTASGNSCTSALADTDPAVKISKTLKTNATRACSTWAVKDLDCPTKGCLGFQFTLPGSSVFTADATMEKPTPHRRQPIQFGENADKTIQGLPNWLVKFIGTVLAPDNQKNAQCNYPTLPSYKPVANECETPDWVPQ